MIVRIWISLFALLLGVNLGLAQEMAPPAELKKLDWYLGEWSGKFNFTMPDMQGEAAFSFKNEMDGNFIRTTSVMEFSGMKMTETTFLGWNDKVKKYEQYTFTNIANTPRIERADPGDAKWVFLSEPWNAGGAEVVSRATLTKKSATEMEILLEFKEGDKWSKV
ncbi:MAG TPA: hypothetical protein PLX06_12825, partial [Fimbriimonadaceae bacterium]|nr:hypothetical protein [Fimbriimonadaceae bacterium]